MKVRKIISLVILFIISLTIVACDKGNNKSNDFSGHIKISGSTSMKPLVEEIGKKFTSYYPNLKIDIDGGGSIEGVNDILENYVQISDCDIEISKLDEYKCDKWKLIDNKVCGIGYAIIINKENKVNSLSKNEIKKIFNGQIKNWNELGGENLNIDIVHRSKKSGARIVFEEKLIHKKLNEKKLINIKESNFSVARYVSAKKGSIGYIALPYLKDNSISVKAIKIDNITANNENIALNKYPFWSYGHMYMENKCEKMVSEFIKYIISNDNKSLMEKLGYIPIDNLK